MLLHRMMAETSARREARRRRILENSENRLRRITARNSPDEIEGNIQRLKSDEIKIESNLTEYNIINGVCNIDSKEKHQNYIKSNDEYENFVNNGDTSTYLSERVSRREFVLCKLLAKRINLTLLAGIVNILLVLKLDNLFGKAVIIPYFLLMLVRLYNCKRSYEAQDGSILVALLILCNIKPNLIYKFKVFLALFNVVLNDFCLYIFSFVLMRYTITYFYDYSVTLLMNI